MTEKKRKNGEYALTDLGHYVLTVLSVVLFYVSVCLVGYWLDNTAVAIYITLCILTSSLTLVAVIGVGIDDSSERFPWKLGFLYSVFPLFCMLYDILKEAGITWYDLRLVEKVGKNKNGH